jgi:hypothetical protein
MALNRDKFRKIVGGITTAEPEEASAATVAASAGIAKPEKTPPTPGQGRELAEKTGDAGETESRRFAKRGRPKGSNAEESTGKTRKVKVSLFLSEVIVNDLYDWAHADKIHPGEMFERALKPFHEKEAKRRNGGKE